MPDLQAITPLGNFEPRVDTHAGATLREVVDVALASVAARLGREEDTAKLMQSLLGEAAPAPGFSGGAAFTGFWMGPDQWMVEAPFDTHEDIAAEITAKADGAASVTEQTDGWCRFDVETGEGARGDANVAAVFELLCPANIRAWAGREATRTSIEHLGCFVVRRGAGHISVIGPRSAAGSIHHALMTAIRSAL